MTSPPSFDSQYGWFNSRCLYQSYSSEHDIGDFLIGDGFYRFVFFAWDTPAAEVADWVRGAASRRPQDVFHFLCNDEFQARDLQVGGLSAHHVSHNAFLDENWYQAAIQHPAGRKFDAVCVSRMSRFKRQHLAAKIRSVLFIGGVVATGDEESWQRELSELMPTAEMTYRQARWLTTQEVGNRVCEAGVGLILSALEGGSYATAEYLLCGLPVVSTGSKGGRDCWLHPRFSRIVPASPEAVAEAVYEFLTDPPKPHDIRDYALRVITDHRRRFFELGQRIYEADNLGRDFARDFYASFRHKVAEWRPNAEVMTVWHSMFVLSGLAL